MKATCAGRSSQDLWWGLLDGAIVLKVIRDARHPKCVIANAVAEPGGQGTPLNHGQWFASRQPIIREELFAVKAAEEGSGLCGFDNRPRQICIEQFDL
jgi:hypothetical protein